MKRGELIVIALVVLFLVVGGAVTQFHRRRAVVATIAVAETHAPTGVRVRVQVLNGTKVRGLARRATMVLRDHGFDVVETGTIGHETDTTIVYDLSGHPDWASRAARAFTPARVEARPDSSRYLDLAVVVGASWRPPAQPFYP